jgi:hypothetical protein
MCNCGALDDQGTAGKSEADIGFIGTSIVEGGSHDVILHDKFSRN